MDLFAAIMLGVIQGISEWLPVSSQAMVTLAGRFIAGLEYREALGVAIWLHSGTLVSAAAYFRNDIIGMLSKAAKGLHGGALDGAEHPSGLQREHFEGMGLLLFLTVATVFTGIVAVPLMFLAFAVEVPDWIFTMAIGVFLVVVALINWRAGHVGKNKTFGSQKEALSSSIIPGLAQGLAVLPGFSRSGLTIASLLGQGFGLRESFRLSFLMSIPVAFGAQVVLPIAREGFTVSSELVVGGAVAAAVGLLTIHALMEFTRAVDFRWATLALGLLVIALGLLLA